MGEGMILNLLEAVKGGANGTVVADRFSQGRGSDFADGKGGSETFSREHFTHGGFDEELAAQVKTSNDYALGIEAIDEESKGLTETATKLGENRDSGGVAGLSGFVDGLGGGMLFLPIRPMGRALIGGKKFNEVGHGSSAAETFERTALAEADGAVGSKPEVTDLTGTTRGAGD